MNFGSGLLAAATGGLSMYPSLIKKGLGALMGGGSAGQDAGNPFADLNPDAQSAVKDFLNRNPQASGQEVMNDPRLAAMFGQNWQDALGQEKDLATRGYSLQPQDYEAFGQTSGDIARMYGQSQAGLQQALASRGLSRSGSAVSAIAGSQGNKNEQLAKLQTDIANKRMQSNLQRLTETRNYLNQLTSQYQNATGAKDNLAQAKSNTGVNVLSGLAQQGNENMAQRAATATDPVWKSVAGGALSGAITGAQAGGPYGALAGAVGGGALGGMSRGSAAPQAGTGLGGLFQTKNRVGMG